MVTFKVNSNPNFNSKKIELLETKFNVTSEQYEDNKFLFKFNSNLQALSFKNEFLKCEKDGENKCEIVTNLELKNLGIDTTENYSPKEEDCVAIFVLKKTPNYDKVIKEFCNFKDFIKTCESEAKSNNKNKWTKVLFAKMNKQIAKVFYNNKERTRTKFANRFGVPVRMGNKNKKCEKCKIVGHEQSQCCRELLEITQKHGQHLFSKSTHFLNYKSIPLKEHLPKPLYTSNYSNTFNITWTNSKTTEKTKKVSKSCKPIVTNTPESVKRKELLQIVKDLSKVFNTDVRIHSTNFIKAIKENPKLMNFGTDNWNNLNSLFSFKLNTNPNVDVNKLYIYDILKSELKKEKEFVGNKHTFKIITSIFISLHSNNLLTIEKERNKNKKLKIEKMTKSNDVKEYKSCYNYIKKGERRITKYFFINLGYNKRTLDQDPKLLIAKNDKK